MPCPSEPQFHPKPCHPKATWCPSKPSHAIPSHAVSPQTASPHPSQAIPSHPTPCHPTLCHLNLRTVTSPSRPPIPFPTPHPLPDPPLPTPTHGGAAAAPPLCAPQRFSLSLRSASSIWKMCPGSSSRSVGSSSCGGGEARCGDAETRGGLRGSAAPTHLGHGQDEATPHLLLLRAVRLRGMGGRECPPPPEPLHPQPCAPIP